MTKFLILTGLSGAGKTFANKVFEDAGFYCVDNLPPALIENFAELCSMTERKIDRVSLVLDIRSRRFFDEALDRLDQLNKSDYAFTIIFLEANDASLVRRFKETRRLHPLEKRENVPIEKAIQMEREQMKKIRDRADVIMDTSNLTLWNFKRRLLAEALGDDHIDRLDISIVSFGYKFGIPMDADMVFDVRFLPNPYYVEELKRLSGEDISVRQYIFEKPVSKEFLDKAYDLISFVVPQSKTEGKANLVIAVGCTGGQHRSVAVAIEFERRLKEHNISASVFHRDVTSR